MWRKLAVLACLALGASAQEAISNATSGPWIAELNGIWRWHEGDTMEWAAPPFDDSWWALLPNPGPLPRPNEIYWIRLHLRLGALSDPGLMLGSIGYAYYVYWDGRRIGQFGELSPRLKWFTPRYRVFEIPVRLAMPGDHVLAIRMWNGAPAWATRRPPSLVPADNRVGEVPALRDAQLARTTANFYPSLLQLLVSFAILLAGVYFLLLPRLMSEGSAFRWFGLLLVVRALNVLGAFYAHNGPPVLPDWLLAGISGWMLTLSFIAGVEFVFALVRRRVPPLIRGVQLLLCLMISILFAPRFFLAVYSYWSAVYWNGIMLVSLIPVAVASIEFRKRSRGAGAILAVFTVSACASLMNLLMAAYGFQVPTALNLVGFRLWYWDSVLLFWIPAMAMQIHKSHESFRHEHERLHGEMEPAKHVQELLVPSQSLQVPGFEIDASYDPATEVGGDFFQFFSASNDSLVVVIGDVSGKGVKAALLVSLIVGALQNRKSDQPATVLTELNDCRLKPVGSDTTESRGTRLKPSEAFPAQSRLKARWAR
ncbi:MAG: SpoIIE family protein phosphatase [Bryobacteraceae bacterium]